MNTCFCFLYANIGLQAFETNDTVQKKKKRKTIGLYKSLNQIIDQWKHLGLSLPNSII